MTMNGDFDPAELTPPKGLPSHEFMVQTWREAKRAQMEAAKATQAAKTAANESIQNGFAIGKLLGEVSMARKDIQAIKETLAAGTAAPTLPPMRPEASSSVNIEELSWKAARAALEGERNPDENPEDRVRRVIVEEEKKRKARLALKEQADRAAEAKAAPERRRKRILSVVDKVVTALAIAGAFELLKTLAAHWH